MGLQPARVTPQPVQHLWRSVRL